LPNLPSIYHVNIRENKIAVLKEIGKLSSLSTMLSLTAHGNPISDEMGDSIKKEIIMMIPALTRINKDEVTSEERDDALKELKERIEEEERKRKEEEEARL